MEQHLEPHAVWLEEVGLGEDGIIKVISKAPQVKKGDSFSRELVAFVLCHVFVFFFVVIFCIVKIVEYFFHFRTEKKTWFIFLMWCLCI